MDELLRQGSNIKDKKYLALKMDYHHILAYILSISSEFLRACKRLERKYPEAKKL